jgi:hypothetical protein
MVQLRALSLMIQIVGDISYKKEWAKKYKQMHLENNLKDMSLKLLVDMIVTVLL